MDSRKPYCFTTEAWEELFIRDELPPDRPIGILLGSYRCSFIDRERFETENYVRLDAMRESKEKRFEKN